MRIHGKWPSMTLPLHTSCTMPLNMLYSFTARHHCVFLSGYWVEYLRWQLLDRCFEFGRCKLNLIVLQKWQYRYYGPFYPIMSPTLIRPCQGLRNIVWLPTNATTVSSKVIPLTHTSLALHATLTLETYYNTLQLKLVPMHKNERFKSMRA